ncbi:ornithine decarboxylase antizyme-domain-containing protein [Schizophyllum commune]
MSLKTMSNLSNYQSSLCPTNGRQIVGDGASLPYGADPSVLAVCHMQGSDDMYYYSTTLSGGPGVSKCPPDRGSLDCVTGSPASDTSFSSSPSSKSIIYPHNKPPITTVQSPYSPRGIPIRSHSAALQTPPLTPDAGSDSDSDSDVDANRQDALDFLMTVFPDDGLSALPYAKSVSINSPDMGAEFNGAVLSLPGKPKTLYVDGKNAQSVSLRESIVALLDLADERLGCEALIIVLERASPALGDLLHSLMYVGGTVVTKPVFRVDPAFVMVGMEI